MNDELYDSRLEELFVRFPSVQKTGFDGAYKPGLQHMLDFDRLLGSPSGSFKSIHVAGTNGKGSVANMLASALAATGKRIGLYTSPHILDFRERMRIIDGRPDSPDRDNAFLISREEVWDFICRWEKSFDELDLSFFEITTGMAFSWFAAREVDIAVIEVGLGGRLDSTNIITPQLSIVTSIGLDHCALLGSTRAEIAGEKAGIFKDNVPALVATRDEETAPVFEAAAAQKGSPLLFADDGLTAERDDILMAMDLCGEYQKPNLRTVLRALEILGTNISGEVADALKRTAARMDFHGRWDKVSTCPDIICDIGHNPPALKENFATLSSYLEKGKYHKLIIVYGVMADKDLAGILPLMPREAEYIFVAPHTQRSLDAQEALRRCTAFRKGEGLDCSTLSAAGSVAEGVDTAVRRAGNDRKTLIYAGGSTFVVSEVIEHLKSRQ